MDENKSSNIPKAPRLTPTKEINNIEDINSKLVIDFLINVITEIRSIRSELRVAPSNKIKLLALNDGNDYLDVLIENNIKLKTFNFIFKW